ncbi:17946_t:CDS:2 [Funneliformis caledonium]|uniref:17946_t:CDS:1 n=1 Tax=Funneliformis caledonium TaxID=1117310 RepID=A0A9N9F4B6_9GLOM|nr:17946_t:CDS:2 [Funneliformis caledonium]
MSSSSDNSSYSKIPILNTLHIIYKRFKDNGYIGSKCPTCNTKRVGIYWCKNCNSEYFRKEFSKWTSESSFMDSFIQNLQLSSHNSHQFVEWIPFNQFKDIKLIAKGGYGVVSSAVWLDGPIGNTKLYHRLLGKYIVRDGPTIIALKSLNNSQNLIMKSLQEDISWGLAFLHQAGLMHCDFHSGNLLVRSERSGRSERSWGSDPKAIYTSRLLNFPNLRQNLSTLHHKIIDVHIKEEEIKEEEEEYKTRQLELDINIDDLEYCKYY